MFASLSILALAALPLPAPRFVQNPAALEAPALVPVVVEHGGDNALRERLTRAGEVWYDAGDFLVGALDQGALAALRARGVEANVLTALGAQDELFIVDLGVPNVRADVDAAAAVLFRSGRQALVSVPGGLAQYPDALRPGHTGHWGHTAITRRPMRPTPATNFGSASLGAGRALTSADPRVQALVGQVSKANIESWVQSYSSYTNRNAQNLANFNAAKAQLIAQLQTYGYSPTTEQWNAAYGANILVDIPGLRFPNRYVVFGSHFDTINGSGGTTAVAHGADDNTSGSAGVLEIARLLATAGPFENSIRLIWFSGEEYGLLGSNANAQAMLAQGKQVVGMLNMDMIAYRASGDVRDCDFATNNSSAALTAFCMQTAPLYVTGWAATSGVLTAGTSDHASYTSAGFPATFFFEDLTQYCPYIHTASDAYPTSTTDFDLAHMICSGVLACGATLAEPADLAIAHTELPDTTDASGPYNVLANITSLYGSTVTGATLHFSANGGQSWQTAAMSANGSTWSGAIQAQGSPLTISYYLEAFDDQGAVELAPEGVDAGAAPYDFFVGTKTVFYATGFEEATDNGWTHGMLATQDDWQRGTPAGASGDPGGAFAGAKAWGNDLGPSGWNGAYANNVSNWLRSPAINCSTAASVRLEFRRWLTVESSQYDYARIKVNGTTVWTNPSNADLIDTAWSAQSLDISALAAHNAAVQIEFSLQSDVGLTYGGWNIDAFQLVELGPGTVTCPPPASYCTAKVNSQGCTPVISSVGSASASSPAAFEIVAAQTINQQNGILFYGFSPAATPLNGGVKCIANPTTRLPLMFSNGNVGPDDCSGGFSYDFNARIRSGLDPALAVGVDVRAQYWYRDPQASFGVGMTDALLFRVCP